jgi:lipopolysaccharide/colanic/teichoic acid biosynthesis glycosyltransferase
MTDDAGWLKDGLLAAVLPHTPSPDAWKLADDLCRGFPEDLPPPLCEVYCYPTDPGEDGQGWTKALGQASDGPAAVRPMEPLFAQPLEPWKRGLDLIGAVVGLLLTAPLFLFLAAAIKLTSRGPVFYRQQRSGLGGKPFTIYKFRTMVPEAEARKHTLLEFSRQDGPAFKMEDDPRVTRVGRFLRITSLDELPQLWNVLRGEMSLVGPRPLPCAESDASEPWHRRRLDVTPGVTCIWQVRGRSQVSFAAWVRMDLEYIARRSIWFDLQLLLETIPAVFFCRGM